MKFEPSFTAGLTSGQLVLLAVLALVALGVTFLLSLRLPLRVLMVIVLVCSMIQGFGPLGFMSFALLFTAALAPGVILRTWRRPKDWWFWTLIALIAWQAVSAIWSYKVGSAAYGVLGTVAVLAVFTIARELLRGSSSDLRFAVLAASPVVVIQAALIILFRISPAIEERYLASPVARFLSEPGVEVLFSGGFENVLDPGKSGGTLLNGNTAALLMALCACVFAYIGFRPGGRVMPMALSALCVIAMFMTGSKSPLAIIVALPLVALVVVVSVRWPLRGALLGVAGIAIAVVAMAGAFVLRPSLFEETIRTSNERGVLWGLVFDAVPSNWFLGLGFGNWREFMVERIEQNPQLAGDPTLRVLPPHNLFAQAWVDSGLIALLLVIVLAAGPIVVSLHSMWTSRSQPLRTDSTARIIVIFIGVGWPVVHGMTDTTVFYGDNHTIAWFAILVAAAFASIADAPEPTEREIRNRAVGGTDSTSSGDRLSASN